MNPTGHMYVNDWGETVALPSATVWEDTKTTRVTYRGDDDKAFRVIVRQKPNPIGFHVREGAGGSGGFEMTTINPDHRHDANLLQQLFIWAFHHPDPQKRIARATMTLLLAACLVVSAFILFAH